ncbi:MAG: ribosome-binding factor A [Candidatus Marinimicrobia bacterium CG08_land_8_20_14_0_20_45_22]|nr:MAG: ribosome-binding factor A [Candidatus Marinimicrobia bacterium CG08_land_8_20_14_0_20_45_22]
MTSSYRIQRVSDEIKRILAEAFIRDIPCDGYGLVTVTKVVCSPDLRSAKVYISILNHNADQRKAGMEKIRSRASFARGILGNHISLRRVPQLSFYEDDTEENAEKIEKLIQSLHQ